MSPNGYISVYDPLDKMDSGFYKVRLTQERDKIIPTKRLRGFYGISESASREDVFRTLLQRKYKLELPRTSLLIGIQNPTEYTCGPLCVYAMAVANANTSPFNSMADINKLEREVGIRIR